MNYDKQENSESMHLERLSNFEHRCATPSSETLLVPEKPPSPPPCASHVTFLPPKRTIVLTAMVMRFCQPPE